MLAALSPDMLATDLAYYLVRKGVSGYCRPTLKNLRSHNTSLITPTGFDCFVCFTAYTTHANVVSRTLKKAGASVTSAAVTASFSCTRTHTRMDTHKRARVHTHAHTHTLTHTLTHARAHTKTHPSTHIRTHTHARTHARTHTHAHTHTRTLTYARRHTHITSKYLHMHTNIYLVIRGNFPSFKWFSNPS